MPAPRYPTSSSSIALVDIDGANLLGDLCYVSFDEFRQSPASVASEVLEHYDIQVVPSDLDHAVELANTQKSQLRFNKGISGRGDKFFSPQHIEHLRKLTQSYTSIDFEAEGLI